ncbi:MAG: hypothetical protein ACRD0C_09525 [Acidimicrobiia bacterium]
MDPGAVDAVTGARAVVVAGPDARAVGAAVARLRAGGVPAAAFVGDVGDEAVAQMAAELFPGAEVVVAGPSA